MYYNHRLIETQVGFHQLLSSHQVVMSWELKAIWFRDLQVTRRF